MHAQGIGQVFTTVFTEHKPLVNYRDYRSADEAMRLRFVEALQDRGVRTTARGTWFMSTALTQADIEQTLGAADDALAALVG